MRKTAEMSVARMVLTVILDDSEEIGEVLELSCVVESCRNGVQELLTAKGGGRDTSYMLWASLRPLSCAATLSGTPRQPRPDLSRGTLR